MSFSIRPARQGDQWTIRRTVWRARINPFDLAWQRFFVAKVNGKVIRQMARSERAKWRWRGGHSFGTLNTTRWLVLFGGVVMLVLLAVVFLLGRAIAPADSGVTQTTSGKVINLQAAMDGFDINEIHVKAGEQVTVNLRSLDNSMHTDGGGKHQFAILDKP